MQFIPNDNATIEDIAAILQTEMPQYIVEIKKNPLMGFQYVEVKKTSFIGAWVNVKKDNKVTVNGIIPSTMARAFLGGLLLLAITYSGRKKIEQEVGSLLQDKLWQIKLQ